jgi:hypothetical protein
LRSAIYGGRLVRRPHPRFDAARNAWVIRAGGRLKVLAEGPKNADTEAAWTAFYAHMNQLGNPVPAATSSVGLGQLADEYGRVVGGKHPAATCTRRSAPPTPG